MSVLSVGTLKVGMFGLELNFMGYLYMNRSVASHVFSGYIYTYTHLWVPTPSLSSEEAVAVAGLTGAPNIHAGHVDSQSAASGRSSRVARLAVKAAKLVDLRNCCEAPKLGNDRHLFTVERFLKGHTFGFKVANWFA